LDELDMELEKQVMLCEVAESGLKRLDTTLKSINPGM
jgi:hypothetical protein